ncbi:MAG: RNA methyltransferase [Planctomycetota bacterium]|nr:RNA methyltransferase [Planctomycetota bacterium]
MVLVRPAGPRNVGMVLRTCENFGPCELVLVDPERPALLLHPEFTQMSHGVADVAEKVRVVDTLTDALADCSVTVGFTARVRDNRIRENWNEVREQLGAVAADDRERLALVFGSEMSGLSVDDASLCQRLLHLRTAAEHTSLNLAICVGIVLQGLYGGERVHRREPGGHPLTGAEREFLKANLKHTFVEHVARSAEAKRVIAKSVDRVFSRAPLETSDARAWHMMMRSLGSVMRPSDFGLDPSPSARRLGGEAE